MQIVIYLLIFIYELEIVCKFILFITTRNLLIIDGLIPTDK